MSILITGGAGYVGSHTVKLLSQRGERVIVFDNLSRGHRDNLKWGRFFRGDLSRPSDIEQCFTMFKDIRLVIHFAAYAYVGESIKNPSIYYSNNVSSTINLLDAMKKFRINTIIFSSTCATYGNPKVLPISEENPQDPINPYGWSKLTTERIIKDYSQAYDFRYIILRYFNAAGADLELELAERHNPETHLIPRLVMAATGIINKIVINGNSYNTPDGTCIRDYIHVWDLARAHVMAMDMILNNGVSNIFNLGTGSGFSIMELISSIEYVSGKSIQAVFGQKRRGDPAILIANIDKAQNVLGWRAIHSDLKTIATTTYESYRRIILPTHDR